MLVWKLLTWLGAPQEVVSGEDKPRYVIMLAGAETGEATSMDSVRDANVLATGRNAERELWET